jgi:hypothetical protein
MFDGGRKLLRGREGFACHEALLCCCLNAESHPSRDLSTEKTTSMFFCLTAACNAGDMGSSLAVASL